MLNTKFKIQYGLVDIQYQPSMNKGLKDKV